MKFSVHWWSPVHVHRQMPNQDKRMTKNTVLTIFQNILLKCDSYRMLNRVESLLHLSLMQLTCCIPYPDQNQHIKQKLGYCCYFRFGCQDSSLRVACNNIMKIRVFVCQRKDYSKNNEEEQSKYYLPTQLLPMPKMLQWWRPHCASQKQPTHQEARLPAEDNIAAEDPNRQCSVRDKPQETTLSLKLLTTRSMIKDIVLEIWWHEEHHWNWKHNT